MAYLIDPNKTKNANKSGSFAADYINKGMGGGAKGGSFASKYMAENAADDKDTTAGGVGPGVGEEETGKETMAHPDAGKLRYIPGGKGQGHEAGVSPSSEKEPGDAESRDMYVPRWAEGGGPKKGDESTPMEPGNFAPGVGPGGEVGSTDMESVDTDASKWGKASGERQILAGQQGEGVDDQMAALEAQKQAGLAKLQAEEAQGTQDLAQAMNEAGIGVSGAFGAGKEGYTTAAALAQQQYAADVEVQKQQIALDWQIKQLETQLSVWGQTLDAETKKEIQGKINDLNQQKIDLEKSSQAQAQYESSSDVMQSVLANALADWSTTNMPDEAKWPLYEVGGQMLNEAQSGGMTYQEAEAAYNEFVGAAVAMAEKYGGGSDEYWEALQEWVSNYNLENGTDFSITPGQGSEKSQAEVTAEDVEAGLETKEF